MDFQTTQKLATLLRKSRRYEINESHPAGHLEGFHQWADGRPCEGAFLFQGDGVARAWLVLIDWKMTGNYYVVLFPENRISPVYEIHKMGNEDSEPTLEWTYAPRKRDGNNKQRQAYFLATYGAGTATLILPKTAAEIDDFLDDLIELAEYRLKADALAENIPPSRDWIHEGFPEGRRLFRLHSTRERNPMLIREAKKRAMTLDGVLRCSCCGFDFGVTYGELGHGYIEVHHTKPLSSLDENGGMTHIEDLALVCSNCHRILHRRRPWLGPEELAQILQR